MSSWSVPIDPLPRVVEVARSVHGDLPVQAWRVEGLWGIHLYRYGADLSVGGKLVRLEHGHAGFTPAGAIARYRFEGSSTHVFAHLEFPPDAPRREAPLAFPTGAAFPALWVQMEEAVGLFRSERRRAEVKVWDVWLTLLDLAMREGGASSDPVRRATEIIERRLHERLTVREIADAVHLSHNQLTRLFRAATGETVIASIQRRRMERARHLLERSTMPIKEVAATVGIDDLQRFNKAVRRWLGGSPTEVRRDHSTRAT